MDRKSTRKTAATFKKRILRQKVNMETSVIKSNVDQNNIKQKMRK